jgi:hypothetical protein
MIATLKQFETLASRANLPAELSEKTWSEIFGKIGQSRQQVENRLAGLRAEDEFTLMALLLGNPDQITPLGQKQWVNWETFSVPDFLMSVRVPPEFVEGNKPLVQRFFVEVKTARKGEHSFLLATEKFNRLLKFRELYEPIPLYFAVRMKAPGFSHWLVISALGLIGSSTTVRARPAGREEECLSAEVVDLLKEDFSGLWLSNYTVLIPAGFEMSVLFSRVGEGPVYDPKFGRLVSLSVKSPNGSRVIEFHIGMDFEDHLTQEVLRRIPTSSEVVEDTPDGSRMVRQCEVNYWVPLYWLVLDTYLDMRQQFEPYVSKTPSSDPTITYFLENFSDFDRNLAAGIRNVVWRLNQEGLILMIKMVPERYLGRKLGSTI